ncbi:unnamed protein product, partial [Phaeothamnion confervicola]
AENRPPLGHVLPPCCSCGARDDDASAAAVRWRGRGGGRSASAEPPSGAIRAARCIPPSLVSVWRHPGPAVSPDIKWRLLNQRLPLMEHLDHVQDQACASCVADDRRRQQSTRSR